MKTYFFVFAAMLALSVSTLGQAATRVVSETKDSSVGATPAIARERFDPSRDPKLDLQKAVVKAKADGKRIILDIGGEWCGWCVFMDKFFVQNPELGKLRDDNFIWVKVNFSEENENAAFLSSYPSREGYPHLYVLDENGKLLHSEDTSVLEKGKGYDLQKFTDFLKAWLPKKSASEN
jgi:thiol-disulfide isomerase/thioredoxin